MKSFFKLFVFLIPLIALLCTALASPTQASKADQTLSEMASAFARLDFQQGISIGFADSRYLQIQSRDFKAIAHTSGNEPGNQGSITGLSYPSNSTNALLRQQWNFPAGASIVAPLYTGFVSTGTEGDTPIATAIVLQSYLEDPSGNMHQFTFNGQTSFTLNPGAFIQMDPMVINLPAHAKCQIRTYQVGTAGSLPINASVVGFSSYASYPHEGQTGSTSAINPTASVSDSTSTGFGPIAVVGLPLPGYSCPSIAICGDSITTSNAVSVSLNSNYYLDSNLNPGAICPTDTCWTQILCRNRAGVVPLQHSGYTLNYMANNRYKSQQLFRYAKTVLIEDGINDLNGSRTANQMESDLLTVVALAKSAGCNVVVCTVGPNNVSTASSPAAPQGFINFSGNTYSHSVNGGAETYRQTYNAFVRRGASAGYTWTVLDLDSFLCPSNSGLWPTVTPIYEKTGLSTTVTYLGSGSGNQPAYGASLTDGNITATNGAYSNPADGYGPYLSIIVSDSVTSANNNVNFYVWDNLTGGAMTFQLNTSYQAYPIVTTSTSTTLHWMVVDVPTYEGIHYTTRTHSKVAAFADGVLQQAGILSN